MALPKKKLEDEISEWEMLPFADENRLVEVEHDDLGRELSLFYKTGRRLGLSPQFLDRWFGSK